MPIVRINGQLHYFAHVPKCGGSAVEVYMAQRFGALALTEMRHGMQPPREMWNRSAAQHMPVHSLNRLFPADWFASSFAVVRHPLRRLYSAFFYARDVHKHLPLMTEFNDWFRQAAGWAAQDPFRLGGHILPQHQLVPESARVFRFEDGLDQIVGHLDGLAGNSDGPRSIPSVNVGKWRSEEASPVPTEETLALVARVYAADFMHFGYTAPTSAAEAAALPDLPAMEATGTPPEPSRRTFTQRLLRSMQAKVEPK
jgi:hypothetical protein